MTDVSGSRANLFVPNVGAENHNPAGMGFWELVSEDFAANDSDFLRQGFWALFWHRFGNWRMGLPKLLRMPMTVVYRVMFKMTEWFCGIHLPYTVRVGRRVRLDHFGGMVLVAQSIGDDVIIRQNTTLGIAGTGELQAWPIIGNRVHIGAGAVIVGRIFVGDDAVVGANAVVVRDVTAGQTVGGVPAKPLKQAG